MKRLRKIPFHPVLFSVYSVLTLYALNLKEVDFAVILRPLIVSLLIGLAVYGLLFLFIRRWEKTAVLTSFVLLLFSTYGYIYQYFEKTPGLNSVLGRHRYLVVLFAVILGIGAYLILFKLKEVQYLAAPLTAMGIFLVGYPLVQIGAAAVGGQISAQAGSTWVQAGGPLTPSDPAFLPDVYFIVLDMYTRGDALQRDFDYDNSDFIAGLRSQGFYVADCSRANYGYTQGSIISALNLDYLDQLYARLAQASPPTEDINVLLKHSLVREQLEALGYQTVAFETGYEWSRLADADIYLSMMSDSYRLQQALTPFEAMYIKTTALLLVSDTFYRSRVDEFRNPNYPFSDHIEREQYLLSQLPKLNGYSQAPKFVFAHVLIPHVPFVFGADGEILTDPGFYSGEKADPVNDVYRAEGYRSQVGFISDVMLEITAEILSTSATPPVIVLMGDHGYLPDDRYMILNAYYLPGEDYSGLYSTISPVNSFRVIFNQYFGQHYDLLTDQSIEYIDDASRLVPETSPECIAP